MPEWDEILPFLVSHLATTVKIAKIFNFLYAVGERKLLFRPPRPGWTLLRAKDYELYQICKTGDTMTHRADASSALDNRGYTGPLIRGANPITLIETAVRDRITESLYWKEQCFGLNAATLLDRAVDISYIGGTYGVGMRPTPFLCLAFKLLTLTPEKEIVLEYLNMGGEEWKYVRALAAFYVRLTFEPVDIYTTLEPFLTDARKLRRRRKEGYVLVHMDEFIDELLTKDRSCATSLWKLPGRQQLEDLDMLEERVSPLQAELDEMEQDEDGDPRDGSESGASPVVRSSSSEG